MRRYLLGKGYKPYDLGTISIRDVVDFVKGDAECIKNEYERWLDIAEFAGKIARGYERKKMSGRKRYSDKVREMIRQQDEIDRRLGRIN